MTYTQAVNNAILTSRKVDYSVYVIREYVPGLHEQFDTASDYDLENFYPDLPESDILGCFVKGELA